MVGCDGSFGPCRTAIPSSPTDLGADVSLCLARNPRRRGPLDRRVDLRLASRRFRLALHAVRSVSRLYLQVPPDTDPTAWSDDQIWEALARRLGHGQDGWQLHPGPITDRSVLPMRSYVYEPMRYGRLFLAGDAAHIVPPTGAKGLNLAVADVALLAPALAAMINKGDHGAADSYSERALRRVWRCTHFSWWMTTMLHTHGDDFDAQLQKSQLQWVSSMRPRERRPGRELRGPADRLSAAAGPGAPGI